MRHRASLTNVKLALSRFEGRIFIYAKKRELMLP